MIPSAFLQRLRRLTRKQPVVPDPREFEARELVVVYLPGFLEADAAGLEAVLAELCDRTGLGSSTMTEQEGDEAAIYLSAPLAEPLFAAIKPALCAHPDARIARFVLATGYGPSREYRKLPLHGGEGGNDPSIDSNSCSRGGAAFP